MSRWRGYRLWLLALALLVVTACVLAVLSLRKDGEPLPSRFDRVEVGMTGAEAKAVMGPWGCEAYDVPSTTGKGGHHPETVSLLVWEDNKNEYVLKCSHED